jgi:hypothetical protein
MVAEGFTRDKVSARKAIVILQKMVRRLESGRTLVPGAASGNTKRRRPALRQPAET